MSFVPFLLPSVYLLLGKIPRRNYMRVGKKGNIETMKVDSFERIRKVMFSNRKEISTGCSSIISSKISFTDGVPVAVLKTQGVLLSNQQGE